MKLKAICAVLWTLGATVQWVRYLSGNHHWLVVPLIYTLCALLYLSGWVDDLRKR